MAVEAAAFHKSRLRSVPHDYDPNIRALLEEGLRCSAAEYARCKVLQTSLREEMSACFADVDALLTPATTGPAAALATAWAPEAEKELGKIPFFVRGKARRNTERFAAERAVDLITVETLYDAKAHFSR